MSNNSAWQDFLKRNPGWSVQWNEATGTPQRAFGKGIRLSSAPITSINSVEKAAKDFLNSELTSFGLKVNQLKLVKAARRGDIWYVRYRQYYDELEVLLSEVELRIHINGYIIAFGIVAYPIDEMPGQPAIQKSDVKSIATRSLYYRPARDSVMVYDVPRILPIRYGNEISYHLVYEAEVKLKGLRGHYFAYVDAKSGELLWRRSLHSTVDTYFEMTSDIQPEIPTEPYQTANSGYQYVTVAGQQFVTDSLGQFTTDVVFNANVTTLLRGPYARIFRRDAPDARIEALVVQGDTLRMKWDDSNSHPAERNAFHHTNLAHAYVKWLDPQFTGMDYQMPVSVNNNGNCNASWNGTGMAFLSAGGGCANTGQMASVIYHEYGHGINQKIYQENGSSRGMLNDAANEGTADVNAAMMEDENRVGRGLNGPNTVLRDLANFNTYPADVTGAIHNDGLILGGAFWDLRLLIGLDKTRKLAHQSKYGIPDDLDLGICYSEWFLEVLVADDDDGDLANGTPNSDAIIQAFNKHGIGTQLYLTLSITHEEIANRLDTLSTIPVDLQIPNLAIAELDSLQLAYELNDTGDEQRLMLQEISAGVYSAELPKQSAGTIVRYYFLVDDLSSNTQLRFPKGGSSYSFTVGYESKVADNMETGEGWTIGLPSDDAVTGQWELADPEGTEVGSQPEDDHSVNGTLCFITGAEAGTVSGQFDVDGGKTTLLSPTYDISQYSDPVLVYHKWYSNDKGATPGSDNWIVQGTTDGGSTWFELENTSESSNGWEKVLLRLGDFLPLTDNLQLRFIAADEGAGTLVEAGLDDLQLLSRIDPPDTPEDPQLPTRFDLAQNFPNPFNPITTIPFSLPEPGIVTIAIYDPLGRKVAGILSDGFDAGLHSVDWDGIDADGERVASGIYIYQIEVMQNSTVVFTKSRKLLLVR